MSVNLSAVSKKGVKTYDNISFGALSFYNFKNDLLKYATNNHFYSTYQAYDNGERINIHYYQPDTYVVCMKAKDFPKSWLEHKSVQDYLDRLQHMKMYYPKMYKIYPFLVHLTYEGEMPYTQCLRLFKLLKEYEKTGKALPKNFDKFMDLLKIIVSDKKRGRKLIFG